MKGYALTRGAEEDLEQIFRWGIEQFGANATERYLVELEMVFDHLVMFPGAARLRTDLKPPVRVYPQDAHVIVYEIEDDMIVILRVRSARENWTVSPLGDGV